MEEFMKTILIRIEDKLLKRASKLTGIKEKTSLVRPGLEALIAKGSSKRPAKFGGKDVSSRLGLDCLQTSGRITPPSPDAQYAFFHKAAKTVTFRNTLFANNKKIVSLRQFPLNRGDMKCPQCFRLAP